MFDFDMSACQIAKELNRKKVRSPKGSRWFASGVINYKKRIAQLAAENGGGLIPAPLGA